MKKLFVRGLSILAILCLHTELQAATKKQTVDQCFEAVLSGDTNKAESLGSQVVMFLNIFNKSIRRDAITCLDDVFGKGWLYDEISGSFINDDPGIIDKSLNSLNNEDRQKRLNQISDLTKAIKVRNAKTTFKKLEANLACAQAKKSQLLGEIKLINDINQSLNSSLIFKETHIACSKLYSSDQQTALLSPNCIEVFNKLGHPRFEPLMEADKSAYQVELSDVEESISIFINNKLSAGAVVYADALTANAKVLADLKAYLDVNIQTMDVFEREAIRQELSQQSSNTTQEINSVNRTDAKSCAEFGYEGVYLE